VKPLLDELLLHHDYCSYDGGHLYAKLARHVFADGNVNWGRIVVMLIAALEMKDRHSDNDNNRVCNCRCAYSDATCGRMDTSGWRMASRFSRLLIVLLCYYLSNVKLMM
jgi:hypothetical protein